MTGRRYPAGKLDLEAGEKMWAGSRLTEVVEQALLELLALLVSGAQEHFGCPGPAFKLAKREPASDCSVLFEDRDAARIAVSAEMVTLGA